MIKAGKADPLIFMTGGADGADGPPPFFSARHPLKTCPIFSRVLCSMPKKVNSIPRPGKEAAAPNYSSLQARCLHVEALTAAWEGEPDSRGFRLDELPGV